MSTRYRSQRSAAPRAPRWLTLRFASPCKVCGATIPAGDQGFYDYNARTVTCSAMACAEADGLTVETWQGSPVSGGWVRTVSGSRLGDGFKREPTWKARYGRCEDAPCCGCCG